MDGAIRFDEADSLSVNGEWITVFPSPGTHDVGSSKLKITNIVNFGWEHKYFPGHLVASNKSGEYLAYGIFSPGKAAGVVRVVHRKTEERALLKGMQGMVQDLSFAHTVDKTYLAVVDSLGTLFVFAVSMEPGGTLRTDMILELYNESQAPKCDSIRRVIWCPYLPEDDDDVDDDDDTNSRLLALINNSVAEMWNLDMVINKYGKGRHEADSLTHGKLIIKDHSEPISDASFSPDGTALATASLDGQVKFFQVYMHGTTEPPRCLHQWSPHDGRPVSSLYFLDNHRNYNPEVQFWKYAVTGADRNSEIKVWSCETWNCIQTVRFQPSPSMPSAFKASLDLSARFLLLSDINRRNVYVLQLRPEMSEDGTDRDVKVVSISEFPTPSPFLSMSIYEADVKAVSAFHPFNDEGTDSEDDETLNLGSRDATFIKFILVQPKSVQDCQIVYDDAFNQPSCGSGTVGKAAVKSEPKSPAESSVLSAFVAAGGAASLAAAAASVSVKEEVPDAEAAGSLDEAASKIKLMSPDGFVTRTAVKKESKSVEMLPASASDVEKNNLLMNNLTSGGSSPSREVQTILADSEEHGGITSDVVITDDVGSDDVEDDELPVEDDDYNEDAEFGAIGDPDQKTEVDAKTDPLAGLMKSLNGSTGSAKNGGSPQPNCDWQVPAVQYPSSNGDHSVHPSSMQQIGMQVQAMSNTVNEMASLIQMQRSEMKVLRQEIRALATEDKGKKVVGGEFKKMLDGHAAKLEASLEKDQKVVLSGLSQVVNNTVAQKLDTAVRREMKKLEQEVSKTVSQGVQQQLGQEVNSRLAKSDQALRDAISKMATSKTSMDSLGNALAGSLAPVLQSSFRDIFANVIAPGFEKSIQALFVNLASVLNKGTKEYEAVLKNQLGERMSSEVDAVMNELREVVRNVKVANNDHQVNAKNLEAVLTSMGETIVSEVRHVHEASVSLITPTRLGGGRRSALQSPSEPPPITKAEITTMLRKGAFNEAFQTALSAKSLSLVVTTCEMVNPTQIFSQNPCPLTQHVLLSLIQQLGHNLHDKTEIKMRYLEEAVMNIDAEDPTTSAHIELVANQLMKQLKEYMNQNPREKLTKGMKLLYLATQALKTQSKT